MRRRQRSVLVPEVVQVGALDCGPAALAAVLRGFGAAGELERLREACGTGRDGTSIDVLEAVAAAAGLAAEQVLVAAEDPLCAAAGCVPSILVVERPGGVAHFVVLWRLHGGWVQVLDPAVGRRWMRAAALEQEVYRHRARVSAAAWRAWATSEPATAALAVRLGRLGVAAGERRRWIAAAAAAGGWRPLAALAAAARCTRRLVAAGAVGRGGAASRLVRVLAEAAGAGEEVLPRECWSVWPAGSTAGGAGGGDGGGGGGDGDGGEAEEVICEGAVLVRFGGWLAGAGGGVAHEGERAPAGRRWRRVAGGEWGRRGRGECGDRGDRGDCGDGGGAVRGAWWTLAAGCAGAAVVRWVEAAGAVGVLALAESAPGRRMVQGALAAWWVVVAVGLGFEMAATAAAQGLGRRREAAVRGRVLAAVPGWPARFVGTRLLGDLAERMHRAAELRRGPELAGAALGAILDGLLAVWGLIALCPHLGMAIGCVGVGAVAVPLLGLARGAEPSRRVRACGGALAGFYVDVLRGGEAVRAHGAAAVFRRRHEALLADWVRARRAAERVGARLEVGAQVVLSAALVGLAVALGARTGAGPRVLLAVVWGERLTFAGQRLAWIAGRGWARDRALGRALAELAAGRGVD
jgi:predicted double-glycine peptidase